MPIVKWSEQFITGLPLMDRQHQEFFRRVNLLNDAVARGEPREALGGSLRFMAEYVSLHFREEEEHMHRAGYPGLNAHRLFHDKLTKRVRSLLQRFDEGQLPVTFEVPCFIADWLSHHIREQDMAYVPWLKAKGLGRHIIRT